MPPGAQQFEAIIFDFDGLIVDTETPLFDAWAHTFERFGVEPIGLVEWSRSLGRHNDDPEMLDPLARLAESLGGSLDVADVQTIRRSIRDTMLDAQPTRPGVEALLDQAQTLDVAVGIASSSPLDWIERHLDARRLLERFPVISPAGDGVPGKPDPAVYLNACRSLGADPAKSLALEDSPNGAAAAKAAAMTCVVVPTDVSRDLDLSVADHVVSSLTEVRLP